VRAAKILIIEDDTRLAQMLIQYFNKLEYECAHCENAEEGINKLSYSNFDLIILDRDLPGMTGIDACKKIRDLNQDIMILMLTAYTDELDLVLGLESGANDYVGKPFKLAELVARVKALLRRTNSHPENKSKAFDKNIIFSDLEIHTEQRKVFIEKEEVALTVKEFDLLHYLSSQPGRVFSRAQILNAVWGSDVLNYEQSINTIVKRLRRKIEKDPSSPKYLETVRGVGYRFANA